MTDVCVMGIGNVLMGDDALGPWLIEALEAVWRFPPEVALIDAGTPGLDLTLFLEGFDALVAIDALQLDGPAGAVHSFRGPDLLAAGLPVVTSPHEPTLRESLLRLRLFGRGPSEVLLVGAIPASLSAGAPLSEPVRLALPEIEARVIAELVRLGVPAARRAIPRVPRFWWERSPRCASAFPAG
jgi:hydrogenase maturation protease